MGKKHRSRQLGKMLGAQLVRLLRRVQRVRQEQQSIRCSGVFGQQHRSLPPAIRVTANIHSSAGHSLQRLRCLANSTPVPLRISRPWRARRSRHAKRKVDPQDRESQCFQRFRHLDKQPCCAIRSRAVCQHDAIAICVVRRVQISVYRRVDVFLYESRCHASHRSRLQRASGKTGSDTVPNVPGSSRSLT